MPIESLTEAVKNLDENTKKVIRALQLRTIFFVVSGLLIVLSFCIGLYVAYIKIDNNSDALRRNLQADCPFYRDIGNSPIQPWTAELGRKIVRDARIAYEDKCAERFGPLRPVDPDLLRPIKPSSTPGR